MEAHCVSAWHVFNWFTFGAHDEHSSGDVVLLQSVAVGVGVLVLHDEDLVAAPNGSREHSAVCLETSLVCWNHFTHLHHERTLGVACHDGFCEFVVDVSCLKERTPVLLGDSRVRKMHSDAVHESIGGRKPFLQDCFAEFLFFEFPLFREQFYFHFVKELLQSVHFVFKALVDHLVDRVQDEFAE